MPIKTFTKKQKNKLKKTKTKQNQNKNHKQHVNLIKCRYQL